MKRVLALILVIMMVATLLPASLVTQAASVTKEGFYVVNWERTFKSGDYDYMYPMPYTWTKIYAEGTADAEKDWYYPEEDRIAIGLYFQETSSSNMDTAAKLLYEEFKNRPAGTRYLNMAALATVFTVFVKDAIDMEDGVRLVSKWLNEFLAKYKALGGELDGIAVDLEYNYYTSFYLESRFCNIRTENGVQLEPRNLDIMQDIVRNERVYQKILRPQLVEYEKQGLFKFYTKDINPATGLPDDLSTAVGPQYGVRVPIPVSEVSTINRYNDNGGDANSRSTWGWVMTNYLSDAINRAVYEPLIKYYPNGVVSDYSRADTYSWYKSMSNTGETTGTSVKVGNASNGVYYGSQFSEYYWASSSGSKTRKLYYKPNSYNKAVFDPTDKFTRALYDVNNQKRVLASTRDRMGDDAAKVNVWVPGYNFPNSEKSYGSSSYFSEVMFHLGFTNPEPFLGYILVQDAKGVSPHEIRVVTDEILGELTRVAGASDRKVIETPMDWNSDYILSGMYAGGRNIWRITPDTSVVSLEDFKVKDYAPTFKVNDVTVTFPQGRIIKDSAISKIGTCGYWVETPADVMPVVTSTADRYENDPSFGETFTNYKTGAFTGSSSSMLKTTSGRPDTYWTVKGTAEIKANGSNQTLALSGATTLTNALVPKKITAGDYYAKQQAWEVKVALPSGDYGEVKLLSCNAKDGGLKISGGKVYYDQSGAYKELSGVNLTAGTYTVKREVDFSAAAKSRYTVYDANGKRLGGTEFVAMASAVAAPVKSITISTTGAAAVELDDYKLYPTGVSTTLELYEADRGRKLTDTNAVRTANTGYRFAWMNAGDTYQVARIYDVKTGTIIKKIEMAPGTDGINSGLVEIGAGKSVQFAVNVKEEAAPAQTNYDKGNFRWTALSESIGLATGEKPAGGNDGGQEVTPPATDGKGEEGDNIYDMEDDDENLNNGIGDPIIPEGDNGNGENPGNPETPGDAENPENPGNSANPENPGTEEPNTSGKNGIGGGMIALIVILSLVVLGGGAAAYIFLIKPKLTAKSVDAETESKS